MTGPAASESSDSVTCDVLVVGAGTAGLPVAIEAADRGARVLIVDKDTRIGGTLHTTGGHIAAAGTRRQRERGIEDSAEAFLEDVRRITYDRFREDLMLPVIDGSAELVDWLEDHGFAFAPETPRIIYGHEPYRTPRTYYGVDAGISILNVFKPMLDAHIDSGRITLWLDTPCVGLTAADDRVVGATLWRRGSDVAVRAGAVVITTGGFGNNAEMFGELVGLPLVSGSHPTSTGDGLELGRAVGAAFTGGDIYLPTFGGLPHPTTPGRVQWEERPLLTSERDPWEIYIDRHGQRWVAEDNPSIDAKERALVAHGGDLTFWTIFDDRGLRDSGTIVVNWTPDDLRERANKRVGVSCADTLEELAVLTGIDPSGLHEAVTRYNDMVSRGVDQDFGRTYLPAPISEPPYYALENHGVTLVTFAGLDVDAQMHVRREDGSVIEGLYAVGEVIGAAATTGQSFCSGMLITPALVHGRALGARLGNALGDPAKSHDAAARA